MVTPTHPHGLIHTDGLTPLEQELALASQGPAGARDGAGAQPETGAGPDAAEVAASACATAVATTASDHAAPAGS